MGLVFKIIFTNLHLLSSSGFLFMAHCKYRSNIKIYSQNNFEDVCYSSLYGQVSSDYGVFNAFLYVVTL